MSHQHQGSDGGHTWGGGILITLIVGVLAIVFGLLFGLFDGLLGGDKR